jgi:hypothetical protein
MFPVVKISMFSLFLVIIVNVAYGSEKNDIFQTAKKYDTIYEKGIYTSGFHKISSPPLFQGQTQDQSTEEYDWQFTQTGKRISLLEVLKEVRKSAGEFRLPNRQCFLFDDKRSGKILIDLYPEVQSSDYLDSQVIKNATLDLHAPDSSILSFQIDMFQMALGRGVCSKVMEVDNSKTRTIVKNGEVCHVLTGSGFYMSHNGTWEIHVLPETAYMLRYAKFLSGDRVFLEIETFGMKNNSDCIYPERSEIRIPIGNKSISHSFVFFKAELSFSSDLFERVTKDFDRELPTGSVVMDDTSGEDKVSVVGGGNEREFYEIPRTNLARRIIFIVIIDILGVLIIIYLQRRSRLKKGQQDSKF